MLQNIRKNFQGTIAKVIVAIIVVPFALFGIESLLGGGGVQYVAEVNGEGISTSELQQQINQQKRRLLMNLGDNVDPSMLDDQMLAGPALEYMIQQKLLMQAAREYGLAISDQRLGEFIADMAPFQVEGVFDPQLYRRVVSDQGYSPAGFQTALRDDLLMMQLRAGLASSEFATASEVDQMEAIREEQRDVRYLLLPLDRFRGEVALDEEQVQDWYDSNQDQFMTEESVELDYIQLRTTDFINRLKKSACESCSNWNRNSSNSRRKDGFPIFCSNRQRAKPTTNYSNELLMWPCAWAPLIAASPRLQPNCLQTWDLPAMVVTWASPRVILSAGNRSRDCGAGAGRDLCTGAK